MQHSVLITGANGFIGSHLCDAFAGAGYRVYGLVRRTSDLRFLKNSSVELLYGDLRQVDEIRLPDGLDVIVHAAALVSDNASRRECRAQIYDITVNLVRWARANCPGLLRFLYISTALTIGYCADGISEDNPGRSAAYVPYNYMKKLAEAYLFEQNRLSGFPAVILRPGDVYGPRDRTSCELMLQAAERNVPLIVGRGNRKFGFCYPENLCQAALAAAGRPGIAGRAYTVTNGICPTWGEFFSSLQAGVGGRQLEAPKHWGRTHIRRAPTVRAWRTMSPTAHAPGRVPGTGPMGYWSMLVSCIVRAYSSTARMPLHRHKAGLSWSRASMKRLAQ